MPGGRRRYRARIVPRRHYKKAKGIWGAVKNVGGMAIKALSMLNSEEKHKDTVYSFTVQTNTADLTLLNGLIQGTTNVTRVGDDVRFSSLFLRLACSHNAVGNAAQYIRYVIFRDNQTNGAAPAVANVLENPTDFLSPLNLDYSRRFEILKDGVFCLTDQGSEAKYKKLYIDLKAKNKKHMHKTDYGLGNAGTVADISTGSYYMLTMADGANGPSLGFTSRMRYIDN